MTLWHLRHCLGLSGDLAQWAHVGELDDEEDCSVVLSAVFVVSAVVLEESAWSAMMGARCNN